MCKHGTEGMELNFFNFQIYDIIILMVQITQIILKIKIVKTYSWQIKKNAIELCELWSVTNANYGGEYPMYLTSSIA